MRKEVRLIDGKPTLCEIDDDGRVTKVLSPIKKVVHTEEEIELQEQYYSKRDKLERDKIERAKTERDNFNRVDSKIRREHNIELDEVEKDTEKKVEKDKIACRYCGREFKLQSIYRHESQCPEKKKMLVQRALLGTPLKKHEYKKEEGDNLAVKEPNEPKELKVVVEKPKIVEEDIVGIKEVEKTKSEIETKEEKLEKLKEDGGYKDSELKELKKEILELKKELNEQIKKVDERIDAQGKKMKRGIVEIFGRKW